jgi:hypothetical protein
MIEAEVTCQCAQIALPDLRLSMVSGQIVYLDEADARASVDLQRAWRAKAVIVKYIKRFRERRAARLALPEPPAAQSVGFLPPGPQEPTVVVDVEAIAQRVAELLEPRLVASVVAALRSEGPVVVAGAPAVPAPPQALVGDDVPVFIPSRIGNALEADLELQATTATEGVVSDAAAALRAARKKQEPT